MVEVTLNECPPGLFWFGDTLGFKSEYTTTLENPRRYQCDAYVVESGEYFHGGAKSSEERGKLLVRPIKADVLARHRASTAPDAEPVADDEETYRIGVDDGRQEMAREIDLATGGDGEFRYCTDHDPDRHCPDADAMKARIIERFTHPAEPAQAVEALRQIEHSIKQARITGNDWRRELLLIENTVSAALAAMGERS